MYQTRSVKSILLLAGSFTFAFLLGELVHEYGHYLGTLPTETRTMSRSTLTRSEVR